MKQVKRLTLGGRPRLFPPDSPPAFFGGDGGGDGPSIAGAPLLLLVRLF